MIDYKNKLSGLIEVVVNQGASDLHLMVGSQPIIRIARVLTPLLMEATLTQEDVAGLLAEMLTPSHRERFSQTQEIDFSYGYRDVRFRGNGYIERGRIGVALRLIPKQIPTLAELRLPSNIESFTTRKQGFFLVAGPVGQGKTTTVASLVQRINQSRVERIITIEDPIEYLFENDKSIIIQREVGIDTATFESGLQSIFREDADVIVIGEMRTPETMSIAVRAAETGHLVFSTLHTNNAAQTIDRIIDSFPVNQQDQVRVQLSNSLVGIFSQRLIPRISGGLVPACELLLNNNAVANLIREKRAREIQSIIETSSEEGMLDMNRSLADLVRIGEITIENAYERSLNPKSLERYL